MKNLTDSFFAENFDPCYEARALALEALCRLALWMADAPTLEDRGLRTSIMLYCVRPDLLDGSTLEKLGELSGRTRQAVHQLTDNFRESIGFSV